MGRRSDSDDDYEFRKSKKKKKRRSRSRSDGSSSSRYSSHKHKKYKKVKRKKHSRSRSRDRSHRRSRSGSNSRGRRSRSRERRRSRSRSRDRYRRRSRSDSRNRRSRSDSRSRNRRSRSDSRSRNRRSRSDSRSRGRRSRSRGRRSRSPDRKKREGSSSKDGQSDIRQQIPGFNDMTPGEQVNARMKLALKAAAAADEKVREQLSGAPYIEDARTFGKAVAKIERDSFAPSLFKSTRTEKIKTEPRDDRYTTHEHAMFGAGVFDIKMEPTKLIYVEPKSYAHPHLYCDPEQKLERWMQKLSTMRRKKMEGEAF